jgi:serine/threonine-protein kinase
MSSDEHTQRVLRICDEALALSRAERTVLLDRACADDPRLRAAVDSLMQAITEAGSFLDPELAEAEAQRRIGTRVGAFTIVERLGEGGMGTVYLAQREAPGYTQRVAIKIIRGQLAGRDVLERFDEERRILAGLNHPYIAGLIDAGTTDDGAPYLVMEYVEGVPIDQFCDERRLDIPARLRLLIKVMLAVQAAHQNLVVHRDLKPSNVLITADGLPKLLDFGIAKLTASTDRHATVNLTMLWGQAMTPNYASPEQILEARATTVSDVYSLGVLAYQLLTGELPYRVDGRSQRDLVQSMEVLAIPRPSSRLSPPYEPELAREAAARRGLTPPRLAATLAGDLDNILLMALRPEPERRYGSVAQFAEDLGRYLDGRPVAARADTFSYRAGKFIRRHWLPLGAVSALVLSLAGGLLSFAWQAEQARAERDRTLKVNEFLQDILLEADPYSAGADATIRDVLRKADEMIAARFDGLPDLEAALRRTIGYTQLGLLELDEAEANLERAHALQLALYGADDMRRLQTLSDLGWLASQRGDLALARERYGLALALRAGTTPIEFDIQLANDFAVVLDEVGALAESLALLEAAEARLARVAVAPELRQSLLNNLGSVHQGLGRVDTAEQYYRRAIAAEAELGIAGERLQRAMLLNNLARLLGEQGRHEEALTLFRESLEVRQRVVGHEHGSTAVAHLQLGRMLLDLGVPAEARPHVLAAFEISHAALPSDSRQVIYASALRARLAHEEGDSATAAAGLAEALHRLRAQESNPDTIALVARWLDEVLAKGGGTAD